jgi:hypothetical protein
MTDLGTLAEFALGTDACACRKSLNQENPISFDIGHASEIKNRRTKSAISGFQEHRYPLDKGGVLIA